MLTFEEIKEVLSNFQKVDNVNPGDRRVRLMLCLYFFIRKLCLWVKTSRKIN